MVSLAWSPGMPGTYIIYKGIQETTSHGEFYYCTQLMRILWVIRDDKVLPFGSSFIEPRTSPYSITTHWRTYRIQSTLSPPQIPTYPSPPQSQLLTSCRAPPQRYTQQLPLNHMLPPHLPSHTPRTGTWVKAKLLVFTCLFSLLNTTWLYRDLLDLPVLTIWLCPLPSISINWWSWISFAIGKSLKLTAMHF